MSIIGTTTLPVRGTCLSWSPKGKQLVVGDNSARVLQYKPEMALVRAIPAPNDIASMQGRTLRCSGLCWLATTDFMVAYSPEDGEEVDIALLVVKKDAPPMWTHFDDITYNGSRSDFPQKITFTPLHQWHIVLCASSKSTEVALLGKVRNTWKCWQLDDTSRIETPVNRKGEETFPVGVCIDISSQVVVKLSDDGAVQKPPCPIVMVLSTDGVLHSFNTVSFKEEHQNINRRVRPPVRLPKVIYVGEVPMRPLPEKEVVKAAQGVPQVMHVPTPPAQPGSVHSSVGPQNMFKQQSVPLVLQPTPPHSGLTQQVPFSNTQSAPARTVPSVQATTNVASISSKATSATVNSSPAIMKTATTEIQRTIDMMSSVPSLKEAKKDPEKVRTEFRNKLQLFDEELFAFRERNDWLADLSDNMKKNNIGVFSGATNGEGLVEEVEELRVCIDNLIEKLELEIKEFATLVREQQERLRCTQTQPRHCAAEKLLDFDMSYRQNKLERALQRVCSKVSMVEDWLDGICGSLNRSSPHRSQEVMLSAKDEQRIVTTARNICKAIMSRRSVLAELQRRFVDLSVRHRAISKTARADSEQHTPSKPKPSEASLLNVSDRLSRIELTAAKEDDANTVDGELCSDREKLIRLRSFANRRGGMPRKVNAVPLKPWKPQASNGSSSVLSRIEARLSQTCADVSLARTTQKMMLDIGTQSPNLMKDDVVSTVETRDAIPNNVQSSLRSNTAAADSVAAQAFSFLNKAADGAVRPQVPVAAKPNAPSTGDTTLSGSATFTVLSSAAMQTPKSTAQPPQMSSTPLTAFKFTALPAPSTSPIVAATSTAAAATSTVNTNLATPIAQASATAHMISKTATSLQPTMPAAASETVKKEVEKTVASTEPQAVPIQPHPSASAVTSSVTVLSTASTSAAFVAPVAATTVAVPAVTTAVTTPASTLISPTPATTAVPVTTTPGQVATVTAQSAATPIPTAVTAGVSTAQAVPAPTQTTAVPTATATSSSDTAVSFTFKLPAAVRNESTTPTTTLTNQEPTVQNNMDEGMMDEEGPSAIPSNLFSSSLSLGLGGAGLPTGANAAKSVFGGGMKLGATPASSSVFGAAAGSHTGSVFGGSSGGSAFQTNAPRMSSLFGGLTATTSAQQQQQTTPSFSFSAALANPQGATSTSVFGAKPVVGGTTTFGGAPSFGSKPTFGAPSPLVSAFGQARGAQPTVPSGGGFSAFAHGGASSGFGALAASQQAQKGSVFGGSGFAALAQQSQGKSSVFGGSFGAQTNTQSSAFSTWR
ncbi:Nuclear pore complex protein [Toxocara canis]|uniref:Nuclear pore complex protein n=1 Tax=Toxocara canis TaxID=6265 RepID=A0A0B2UZ00_TOXCA|nr:Nuclear pore complex protein [Toxocara canis]